MTESTRTAVRPHRPLLILSAATAVLAVVAAVGVFADPRVITGAPAWLKPLKFAVSFAVYGLTLAWMLSLLPRRARWADHAATLVVLAAFGELLIIVGQVVRGRASHFNATTGVDGALWTAMGQLIMLLFLAHLVIAVVLVRRPLADRATAYGVRLGLAVSGLGMAVAVPMTLPSAAPGTPGIQGAHSVGVPDGGPGLPVTGWSTVGGDLRVGHFVGLHALQALPLLAWLLTVLARRGGALAARLDDTRRARLVLVAGAAYAALTVLLTWQALRGQPLLRPDLLTLAVAGALAAGTAAAVAAVVRAARPAPVATPVPVP
jgi:hypothetical protein